MKDLQLSIIEFVVKIGALVLFGVVPLALFVCSLLAIFAGQSQLIKGDPIEAAIVSGTIFLFTSLTFIPVIISTLLGRNR